ncbi:hypothetical protein T492DRAFT_991027 [Pavlovales sp. CCMP2436]|nr:hypothetical protein T492DRAFT_991027 [Pavlovales sp. CCMP2436]
MIYSGPFGAPAWPTPCHATIERNRKSSHADVQVAFTQPSIRYLSSERTARLLELRATADAVVMVDEEALSAWHRAPAVELPTRRWRGDSPAALASVGRLPWHRSGDASKVVDLGATFASLGVESVDAIGFLSPAFGHAARSTPVSGCANCAAVQAEVAELRERCHAMEAQLSATRRDPDPASHSRARLHQRRPLSAPPPRHVRPIRYT